MESFSRPSVTVAAAVLGLIALAGFAVGFKGSFSRPGEATPSYAEFATPAQTSLGEPTAAKALTEPLPISAAAPDETPASAAAPKSAAKPKPKPTDDTDATDAAADQNDTPVISSDRPARTPRSSAPATARPAPAPSGTPASDTIGDLIPPH